MHTSKRNHLFRHISHRNITFILKRLMIACKCQSSDFSELSTSVISHKWCRLPFDTYHLFSHCRQLQRETRRGAAEAWIYPWIGNETIAYMFLTTISLIQRNFLRQCFVVVLISSWQRMTILIRIEDEEHSVLISRKTNASKLSQANIYHSNSPIERLELSHVTHVITKRTLDADRCVFVAFGSV